MTIKEGVCYCQCEGAYEEACGICPVHPATDEEMRARIRAMLAAEYQRGAREALYEATRAIEAITVRS